MIKKIINFTITFLVLIGMIGLNFIDVTANSILSCDTYEVDYIEDNGNFKKISCHSSFDDAKQAMKKNKDYVIRHKSSQSAMKIVAMNSGVAYTNTTMHKTASASVVNIYGEPTSDKYNKTYVTQYIDGFYLDTTYFNENDGSGKVRLIIADFEGLVDIRSLDLVPSKFLKNNIKVSIQGKYDKTANINKNPEFFKVSASYYSIKQNGNYNDLVFTLNLGASRNGQQISYDYIIGPAPEFMSQGKRYYSYNAYDFYSDVECTKKVGTEYNYYQFLPLRSESKINSNVYNKILSDYGYDDSSKLWNTGDIFLKYQQKNGVNALLIYAIGLNESGFGTSYYAKNYNNLFGLNAVDSNPDNASRYKSVDECIETMMSYYVPWYLDCSDNLYFGPSVGNKGMGLNLKYASDPYWSIKVAKYAYKMDKIANDYNGKLTDYKTYNLKRINEFKVKIYEKADTKAKVLDTSNYTYTYQKNNIVIPLGKPDKGFQKIQFTNPIVDGKVIKEGDLVFGFVYDWDKSVGYIEEKYLDSVYEKNNNDNQSDITEGNVEHKNYQTVISANMERSVLKIDGIAFVSGYEASNKEDVKHELVLFNTVSGNEAKIKMNTYQYNIDINDGYKYDYIGYKGEVDLITFRAGVYRLYVDYTVDGKTHRLALSNNERTYENQYGVLAKGDYNYRLYTKQSEFFTFFLDLNRENIDYSVINKPTRRTSAIFFDELNIEDNKLLLDGFAYAFDVNMSKNNKAKHSLMIYERYGQQKLEEVMETKMFDYDITSSANYSFDINNSRFYYNLDLSKLKPGIYDLKIKVENDKYLDIYDMNHYGSYDGEYKKFTVNGKKYKAKIEINKYTKNVSLVVEND